MIRIYPLVYVDNEVCSGISRANDLHYEVAPVPLSEDWIPRVLDECAIPSIRIKDGRLETGSVPMFASGDFCPCVSSDLLSNFIAHAPVKWEVLVLTAHKDTSEIQANITILAGFHWEKYTEDADIVGLIFRHAGVLHELNRVAGNKITEINKCVASLKEVYMCDRLFTKYREKKEQCRDRRLLAVLSSYKRVKDACRQIYTMMDQSYTNFELQVMLRGVSEYDWKRRIQPNFQHFIDERRMRINFCPNLTQLDNIAHFGDGIDPDLYDLICKIDDDDWYDRDYLKRVNFSHKHFPLDICSMITWIGGEFRQKDGYPYFSPGNVSIWGGSQLVLSKNVHAVIRKYVEEGNASRVIAPILGEDMATWDWSWREDNFVSKLADRMGYADRYHMDKGSPGVLVTRCGTSMTRSEVSREWYINWKYRNVLHVCIDGNIRFMRIDGSRISEVGDPNGLQGDVVGFDKKFYIIKWKGAKTPVTIVKRENGLWEQEHRN